MISDRRRRCGVLPYCGGCRAVWSERWRRGCIRSPPPIGGDHDRVNLLRLRGSRYWHRSRGGQRCREHRRGKSGRRRTRLACNRRDRRSLVRLRGSRNRHRSRGGRRDRCCNLAIKSRRRGRIKSGRSSSRGYCPSARFGRNRNCGNDARLRFRRLPNVDQLQFFARAGSVMDVWLELLRWVSLLFRTMLLGPVPTIGGGAGNAYPPNTAR